MNHEEYRSNGQAVSDLVRTVAPRGCSVATYSVLLGAVRGAINITAVRSDGHVHRDDVLKILRTAIDGSALPQAGHVCPVPYGLGPEDLDVLERMRRRADRLANPDERAVLSQIIAMHRAPTGATS